MMVAGSLAHTTAQTVLFDFESAPVHAPLPVSLTASGLTAELSATGEGFSVQPANTMGFTPAGFSGNCLFPSSVYAADLWVAFSQPLVAFSILYAPQELACDSSARLRVTVYFDQSLVGTSTMTADPPGTWPSATLAITSAQPFNRVVVHYDAPPPTGGDWGPIFMADNLQVELAPPSIVLTGLSRSPSTFQLGFTHTPGRAFSLFATTNPAAPFSSWVRVGQATEGPPGQYSFTDSGVNGHSQRFYRVATP